MLNDLKHLFLKGSGSGEKEFSQGADSKFEKVQIATCSVLIEIANSDNEFADVEKDMIMRLIKGAYDLDDDEVNSLMELSQHRIAKGESSSVPPRAQSWPARSIIRSVPSIASTAITSVSLTATD